MGSEIDLLKSLMDHPGFSWALLVFGVSCIALGFYIGQISFRVKGHTEEIDQLKELFRQHVEETRILFSQNVADSKQRDTAIVELKIISAKTEATLSGLREELRLLSAK